LSIVFSSDNMNNKFFENEKSKGKEDILN